MNKKIALSISAVAIAVGAVVVGGNICAKSIYLKETDSVIAEFNKEQSNNSQYGYPVISLERTVLNNSPFSNKINESIKVSFSDGATTDTMSLNNDVSIIPFYGADISTKLSNDGIISELKKNISFNEVINTSVRVGSGFPVVDFELLLSDVKSTKLMTDMARMELNAKNIGIKGTVNLGEPPKGNIVAENSDGLEAFTLVSDGFVFKTLPNDYDTPLSMSFGKFEVDSKLRSDKYDGITEESKTKLTITSPVFDFLDYRTGEALSSASLEKLIVESGYVFDLKDARTDIYVNASVNGLKMPDNSLIDYGIQKDEKYSSSLGFQVNELDSKTLERFVVLSYGDPMSLFMEAEQLAKKIVNEGLSLNITHELVNDSIASKVSQLKVSAELSKNSGTLNDPSFLMKHGKAEAKVLIDMKAAKKVRDNDFHKAMYDMYEQGFATFENDTFDLDIKFENGKLFSRGVEKMNLNQ